MSKKPSKKVVPPFPGSKDAVKAGCKCPIVDNNFGAGSDWGGYIISSDCPLHGADGGPIPPYQSDQAK